MGVFGKNNAKEQAAASQANGAAINGLNRLAQGTIVEGTINTDADIRIDGVVKGKLYCSAKLLIGPTGVVEGDIFCTNAIIEGKFTGNIEVTELLNARKTAEISGVIVTGKIQIEAGAVIDVQSCKTGGKSKSIQSNGQQNAKGKEAILSKEAS